MNICCNDKNETQDNQITPDYSQNVLLNVPERTKSQYNNKIVDQDQASIKPMGGQENTIFMLNVNNQQIQENKEIGLKNNNENFDQGKHEENYSAVDKLTQSKIQTLVKDPMRETNSHKEQVNQINQQFSDFPQESYVWSEQQSLQQNSFLSETAPQSVPCIYCGQLVYRNFIQLECLHFYCRDCLLEEIKNQCQSSGCIGFYCRCTQKISAQTILQTGKVGLASVLLDKLRMNQLRKLYSNIKSTLTIWSCPNKYCIFFCIFQPNQHQNQFYCPNCLAQFELKK